MKLPFREYHLFSLLETYEAQNNPLDVTISQYFKGNKALGSKDRAYIAETCYQMMRWKGLLDALIEETPTWETRFQQFQNFTPQNYLEDESLPWHTRVSFPEPLFDRIVKSHGLEKAVELCLASNQTAPTTIRVNTLKISRDALLAHFLEKEYPVVPCSVSPTGIIFKQKYPFFTFEEFKKGWFEVQDEASQLVGALVKASPGELVMDYCAGSGGKTLAFAPQMLGQGQIFLHDIRPWALLESKKRLRRAGIQNAQITQADNPKLHLLKKKMDWVLVDVPCTGTGTLRRNPDMKWRFTPEALKGLIGQQRTIFERALSFLKPKGFIVYSTCSLLNDENQDQVSHFQNTYNLTLSSTPFSSLPVPEKMDGFYCATLQWNG